jgi:hypothetical protein
MTLNSTPLEIMLGALLSIAAYLWARYGKRLKQMWQEWRKQRRGPRQLRPRQSENCPECRAGIHWLQRHPRVVEPWSEVKNCGGHKKRSDTSGYACLNARCDYYGITDAAVHCPGRKTQLFQMDDTSGCIRAAMALV